MHPDSLADDLLRYLHRTVADTPRAERGRWVMSAEWLNEVRKLDDRQGAIWVPCRPDLTTIVGLPYEVTDDAGAPRVVPLEDARTAE